MTRPVASQRFRQRKLSTKHALQILREEDLEENNVDGEPQNTAKVETGVEKHEETEHHLQAAISASHAAAVGGRVAQVSIPTPETNQSAVPYERLYTLRFAQPATYIRFSSTVEDCVGCQYNLTEADDVALKRLNDKLAAPKRNGASSNGVAVPCTEDQFEEAMDFFEETAKTKQPFSGVGEPPPILSWDEMQDALDDDIDEPVRLFARDIYPHWRSRRHANGNTALQPGLRLKVIEAATDVDDNDPYVCFRRREMRQARKTRGRDAQSAEKLRRLRRELEDARQLVALVRQRELLKKEQLTIDRTLFEQRVAMRKVKRQLPSPYREGDDDLLINQKQPKKKPSLTVPTGTPITAVGRLGTPHSARPDGRMGAGAESDLVLLADLLVDKQRDVEREIAVKKAQHTKWNENFVDATRDPLDPEPPGGGDAVYEPRFRPATTKYLPTPPASVSSEAGGADINVAGAAAPERGTEHPATAVVRFSSPPRDDCDAGVRPQQPSFRLRTGRLGRLWLDRRGLALRPKEGVDPMVAERFKYDRDSSDEEDGWGTPYRIDPDDPACMRYRAAISGSHPAHTQLSAARRAQVEAVAAANAAQQQQQQLVVTNLKA